LNLKAPLNSPAFTGTVTGVTSAMVGLGSVNNTSDDNKAGSFKRYTNRIRLKRQLRFRFKARIKFTSFSQEQ
jgi:hypothetical protein